VSNVMASVVKPKRKICRNSVALGDDTEDSWIILMSLNVAENKYAKTKKQERKNMI